MQDVKKLIEEAQSFGRFVCNEKGLTVLNNETPTEYQRGVAALHAREDAAACFFLLTHVLKRQHTIQRWLYVMTFVLVCILFNMR